ncbi:class I SAM-dependent methyltransferase [Halodesulfovibrio sp.]|jgi:SAM-dependent methyltransferase|uniref:class I SAM-dependent methyltransferase n=1 Tax=Halodesulfovibrio sp. TaxID=1912772 RepID=UPI0025CE7C66|nr:class I SAM-dependent methyltransferase [Halodesulfovibrio sp.]MCT4625584.1 class I SAM-dependent methyltransferase [Halodesulfovibrio sp.]
MTNWTSKETVDKYTQWNESPAGIFALRAKMKLIADLISGWPRRGRRFLEVGCAAGRMTEMFYHAGFDVTGLDCSPSMLEAARELLGQRAEFFLGKAEHLPFEDRQFDYVGVGSVLEFVDDPEAVLEEALRVASRGVIVTVYSKWSLYYLSRNCSGADFADDRTWLSPFAVDRMLRNQVETGLFTRRSILLGPVCTWRDAPVCNWLNSSILPYGFGALSGVCIDKNDTKMTIPLMVKKCSAKPSILNACRTNLAARNSASTFDK